MKILQRALLALALALSLSSTAQPAAAWGPLAGKWPSGTTVRFCEASPGVTFPYRSMWNTVSEGIQRWNGLGNIGFAPADASHPCKYTIYYQSIGPAAYTSITVSSGTILSARTYFNSAFGGSFWWYGATQNCYVGVAPGCHLDAWTIATHEAGHAIGLTHNTLPDNDLRCVWSFYSNQGSGPACVSYGTAIMHWDAGAEFESKGIAGYDNQGYRHLSFSSDDLGALHQGY